MISLIAAVSENNVIGLRGSLPWQLSADARYFVDMTKGKTIVMGRTTFQLIIAARAGKPLENRTNIVLTTDPDYTYPGVHVIHHVEDITSLHGEVMVLGGAKVYEATIGLADRLYVTEVHAVFDGDAYFPNIDTAIWHEVSRQSHKADVQNQYDFDFVVYDRI